MRDDADSELEAGLETGGEDDFPLARDGSGPPSWRRALLLAAAVAAALFVGLFLWISSANSDRYKLRCTRHGAEARQGLFFFWGTALINDDAHAPVDLPTGVSCAGAEPDNLEELDAMLGALLLEAAEIRLQRGEPEELALARQNLERARRLGGLPDEQRGRAESLLADMTYHEAREILRQVERDLWQARRKLERARRLGVGRRIGDLDEWLEFAETETERFRPALGESRLTKETSLPARPAYETEEGQAEEQARPRALKAVPASPDQTSHGEDVFL